MALDIRLEAAKQQIQTVSDLADKQKLRLDKIVAQQTADDTSLKLTISIGYRKD
ncbi:hypothetical protein [Lactobacillus sp. ESL0677]|uniref:hypothetical protein n=1 Tax=Lactobacillus sp. ESL0677 TaxID=2983208 RepID=UPI0023F76FA6|nr:hypothetical protein [Lactobacillus sp. ESL0677]WEV36239.1 hypothetical protein OZX76_05690 [Lactobacillus sp. ESL0677]